MTLVDFPTVAVAMTSLGAGILGVVYNFYYIKVFLEFYQIQPAYLNMAQILFMIWNAINDPLFGCIQDVGCGRWAKWLMNRRKVILYMGPFFSASFLIFWFPWTKENPPWIVGVHLLTSLFVYDSLFSFVLSAHCGLFTELSTEHSKRVRVVIYMEIASVIGSLAIFPVDKLSRSLADFAMFQWLCVAVAIISACCFLYTGLLAPREVAQVKQRIELNSVETTNQAEVAQVVSDEATLYTSVMHGLKSSWQIIRERDFLCVVFANFFRIMRVIAASNFTAIFIEALVSPSGLLPKGSTEISIYYQLTQTLPPIVFLLFWPLLTKLGPWLVNNGQIFFSCVNCILMLVIGRHNHMWLVIFLLVENILCRAGYPGVYNIFFPDVVDEDMMRHDRKSPLSTMVFTLNALITKPANSFAPMIVVFFLSRADYASYNKMKHAQSAFHSLDNSTVAWNATVADSSMMTSALEAQSFDHLFDVMFIVACVFPLICAVVEGLALTPYRLKFRHRRSVVPVLDNEIKKQ
uniref:Uncharacterized protein n=1 Tax=Plectus sambesii TaxID=2011161 RepID=A0A914WHR8_9BILA